MPGDRIILGAAALPEPDRAWLAAAERLAIESVWQGGHVLPRTATGEAITRLSLMTAWTERVRVGSAVLVLPLYHPVLVAKQLADLDAWSGGRLSVGVGVGGEFPQEFEALGVPRAERGARTDEAMELLRALWRGGRVTHHGRFFDLDDVELIPVAPPDKATAPPQLGGPPLLVSGRKEAAMRRAACLGDGWMPYLFSPDAYARSVQTIQAEAKAAGRDLAGFEWGLYLYCSIRPDGDRARADVATFLGGAYGDKPGAMLDRIAPAGTPEEVAARVQQYVDAGARHIVISPAAREDTLEVVTLAATEVLPRLTLPERRDGDVVSASVGGPCAGLSVVEVAVGTSELGLGLAGGVPGMIFADLGATVVRVTGTATLPIDAELSWSRSWHRDKRLVATDDAEEIRALLRDADAALVYGAAALVEERGLAYEDLAATNPGLVYARCGPSRTARGTAEDFGLLVEAKAGFCTQLGGHRPGPIFVDVRASGIGTAALLTTSVLALLRRRALTGAGGWAETSLYDGMLATLGCMIGRSERAAPEIEGYWEKGSTFPNFLYRCADGELVQVWFGGKGMYGKLLQVLGDEPSEEGYYADQMAGRLGERAKRWVAFFAQQPRDVWIERLRAAGVACEPVFAPGEALADPHLAEIGLAIKRSDDGARDVVVATPIAVVPAAAGTTDGDARAEPAAGLLDGLRVADFSAFVAGPLGAEVLADLGAEVIKVEPPDGEAMRAAAYAIAACQRGKRSLALDIGAPDARPVVELLLDWADVVLHNFRVGVSERLGIDEATAAAINPNVVYCHASAFGPTGWRAKLPGNDALMQAVTGFEWAVGGEGNDPIAGTWIPIDMTGGWVAAVGMLAGLYARAESGRGQQVATSLLGAGMLLQSGVFERDGELVPGPHLDGGQTGYGPGYRIYEGGDGQWFALVLPDEQAWRLLGSLPETTGLPAAYAPLRGGANDATARRAERILEGAFAASPAGDWVGRLRDLGLLVELIEPLDRDGFRRGILDDPVNRELGRAVAYETADWGHFEQIGPLLRCGPDAGCGPRLMLPGVGEHTVEVLTELGFAQDEIDALLAANVARQGE